MDDLHRVNDELPVEQCDGLPLPADSVAKAIPMGTLSTSSDGNDQRHGATPYTIHAAIADAVEQIGGEPFPDPFTGDHTIEYWIWTGTRLVPASPEEAERLRQEEALEQEELRLLHLRQDAYRQHRRQSYRRFAKRLVSPLVRLVSRWGLFAS
jgi:hypothetical protein